MLRRSSNPATRQLWPMPRSEFWRIAICRMNCVSEVGRVLTCIGGIVQLSKHPRCTVASLGEGAEKVQCDLRDFRRTPGMLLMVNSLCLSLPLTDKRHKIALHMILTNLGILRVRAGR